ncbi:leukocyte elastase inhibitor-like [Labrus mixtus]|uniref:leukocyte elastase inhibitor-like n=1 Tax=Labrus mixtus TaxID=508554 RepID=UPI0029C087FC|nr:leukocyte elastase inhibitor-like [Labrus mixtus]
MASTSPPFSLSKANSTFSLDLFKKLSDDDKTANIFYSPLSISSALAMVMLGARANTAAQMSEVLGFSEGDQPKEEGDQPKEEGDQPMEEQQSQLRTQMHYPFERQMQTRLQMKMQLQIKSKLPAYLRQCLKPENGDDEVHAKFGELLSELNKEDAPYALSVANRLYGEKSYRFNKEYIADTKKHYNAELKSVDFKKKAEEARVHINDWVEKNTQGKIKDLLAEGAVDDMTRLALINAVYFKGTWDQQFKEQDTVEYQFRVNKNDTKLVKMMQKKSKFAHRSIPEINIKVLEMPYKGEDLSMIIFLPHDIEDDSTGLENLETELTHQKFVDWSRPDMMDQGTVEVKLPRFKLEETYELNNVLKKMGMLDAFDVAMSDFSGMSPANDLFLSKVVHKAFVDVNEEGTEAAAATGIVMGIRSIDIPFTFIADHPFLFFIKHIPTKTTLFAGRYCSPE